MKTISPMSVYVPPPRLPTAHLPVLDITELPNNPFWATLGRALTLKRGHESATEAKYVAWLANRLPLTMVDGAGNLHVDLRQGPQHRTMFTSHLDTVHRKEGENQVHVDGNIWRASEGNALGADDGAGNAIMAHMIEAGVPGYYVFFRGEECGGVGSSWLAKELPELFADIDRAVAFDRAGYSDVITYQSGGRCCSDTFADALATALTTEDEWFVPDNTGVYTDTAEFTRIIPECTNLSVGYKHQHGDREELNVDFCWFLAQQAVLVNWDALPTERAPKAHVSSRYDIGWYDDWATQYRGWNTTTSADMQEIEPLDKEEEVGGFLYTQRAITVMDALRAAIDAGTYRYILDEIAKVVDPIDPNTVVRQMNASSLDDDLLEYAYEMIETGFDVDVTLYELFEAIQAV